MTVLMDKLNEIQDISINDFTQELFDSIELPITYKNITLRI